MTNKTVKYIFTTILFGIAGIVLYFYFGEAVLIKLNIQEPTNYPLAGVDILSEVKQEQALTITSGRIQIDAQNLNYSVIKSLPTETNIYEYESSKISRPENQKALAEAFGLSAIDHQTFTDQIIGKYVSMVDENSSLRIYEDLGIISYSKDKFINRQKFTNFVETESYKLAGESFIRSKGINLDNFVYDKTKYYSADGDDAEEVSNPSRGHIIEFSYRARVLEIPIIDNNTDINGNPLRVWLDVDKNIIRMEFNEVGTVKNSIGSFKLKNKNQVANDIQTGKLKLINSKTPIGEEITSASLNGISVGYYAVNGFLVPVYIFEASSITADKSKGASYFIMEAVAK